MAKSLVWRNVDSRHKCVDHCTRTPSFIPATQSRLAEAVPFLMASCEQWADNEHQNAESVDSPHRRTRVPITCNNAPLASPTSVSRCLQDSSEEALLLNRGKVISTCGGSSCHRSARELPAPIRAGRSGCPNHVRRLVDVSYGTASYRRWARRFPQ